MILTPNSAINQLDKPDPAPTRPADGTIPPDNKCVVASQSSAAQYADITQESAFTNECATIPKTAPRMNKNDVHISRPAVIESSYADGAQAGPALKSECGNNLQRASNGGLILKWVAKWVANQAEKDSPVQILHLTAKWSTSDMS